MFLIALTLNLKVMVEVQDSFNIPLSSEKLFKHFFFTFKQFCMDAVQVQTRENVNEKSLCVRKPTIWVSDQVRHKPGCTSTEDG